MEMQSSSPGRKNPCISTGQGPTDWKAALQEGCTGPGGEQVEHEPMMHPYQQVERGDFSSLFFFSVPVDKH